MSMHHCQFVVRAMTGSVLLTLSAQAAAQQILSAVESENNVTAIADLLVGGTPGALVGTTFGGADTRVLTNYGVNKLYASGTSTHEQYASSAWVDSFTVAGTPGSTVAVSFNFSVDGLANFNNASGASFNFNIYALRGNNWSVSGYAENATSWSSPQAGGTNYERLILSQTVTGRVSQADMRSFDGFYNYANNAGQPGAFASHVTYNGAEDYFRLRGPLGGEFAETRYYATAFRQFVNGVPTGPMIPYNINAQTMQQGAFRASFVANYGVLGSAQLCAVAAGCGAGNYPGSNLSLNFNLAAGSTFSLASWLWADDLNAGTIDFFNTARVSSVTVSPGASLTSASGALVALPGGGFGYPAAAVGAVPEPASWAMLIIGFGIVGYSLRSRRQSLPAKVTA